MSSLWYFGRISHRATIGATPFSFAYGVDAVILVQIDIPTFRVENFNDENNDILISLATDLLEEPRDLGQIRDVALQQATY